MSAPDAGAAEGRVVIAPLPCRTCARDLRGRPIERGAAGDPPRVGCPACGRWTPAAPWPAPGWLETVPARLLAAGRLATVVAGLVGLGLIAGGLAAAMTSSLIEPFQLYLARRAGVSGTYGRSDPFDAWWAEQDPAALVREAGGFWSAIDPWAAAAWSPGVLATFLPGCLVGVLLAGGCRRRLAAGVVPLVVAVVTATTVHCGETWSPYLTRWSAARAAVGLPATYLGLVVWWGCVTAGLLAGRPLGRALVVLFVPPRLRRPLWPLWTRDGLAPPRRPWTDGRIARS